MCICIYYHRRCKIRCWVGTTLKYNPKKQICCALAYWVHLSTKEMGKCRGE